MSHNSYPVLPSLRMNDYDHRQVVEYLSLRHARNKNIGYGVHQFTHGATVVANGYTGGVYSPTQNRIYFVPYAQSFQYLCRGVGLVKLSDDDGDWVKQ